MKAEISGIFPEPIYRSTLNRKLTKEEVSFIDKNKTNVFKNEGNTTSNDTYILNKNEFKNLKKN